MTMGNILARLGRFALLLTCAVGAVVMPLGCGEEKPAEEIEEKPAAPPPPTKEQMFRELMTAFPADHGQRGGRRPDELRGRDGAEL
jgi:hypothetical protein